jgi:hypothetical protein
MTPAGIKWVIRLVGSTTCSEPPAASGARLNLKERDAEYRKALGLGTGDKLPTQLGDTTSGGDGRDRAKIARPGKEEPRHVQLGPSRKTHWVTDGAVGEPLTTARGLGEKSG